MRGTLNFPAFQPLDLFLSRPLTSQIVAISTRSLLFDFQFVG